MSKLGRSQKEESKWRSLRESGAKMSENVEEQPIECGKVKEREEGIR